MRPAAWFVGIVAMLAIAWSSRAAEFDDLAARARGQTVYWNAWAGDEKTNAFIAWVGEEVARRYGIKLVHVRIKDTSEAVARVIAEKAAGRSAGGSVDLIWLNGPNFLALKEEHLLFGPYIQDLPNARYLDTTHIVSNFVDFTVPVDGYASPWRRAQIVFVYDSARVPQPPRSSEALLEWAQRHPGRTTHPNVRNFLGATFLKQALYELAPDASVLRHPADDATFERTTAPLWRWYDALRPNLWRKGEQFPESGPAMRQLMNDSEIDLMISFNPAEAAVAITAGLLPPTARTVVYPAGTIGNTSFVGIPFNAAHKEGAEVVANFLLEPEAQARAQDFHWLGSFTVLDLDKLPPAERGRFAALPQHPALPASADLARVLPEPHPSWMTRLAAEWERRYIR
ncbi:MAG TPA: ABC transporter substrate-binding protein [Casimicrobiaceae bacterium]|nr:ABC transporter substrate-binding protein [Casimicrobiaceae bacterium]